MIDTMETIRSVKINKTKMMPNIKLIVTIRLPKINPLLYIKSYCFEEIIFDFFVFLYANIITH